jgi:membrane protein DedA with SNARE-associated domain
MGEITFPWYITQYSTLMGIFVGSVSVILVCLAYYWFKKKKQQQEAETEDE